MILQAYLKLYLPGGVHTVEEISGTYQTEVQYSAKVLVRKSLKENVDSFVCDNKKLTVKEQIACNYMRARVRSDSNPIQQPEDHDTTRPVLYPGDKYVLLHLPSLPQQSRSIIIAYVHRFRRTLKALGINNMFWLHLKAESCTMILMQ